MVFFGGTVVWHIQPIWAEVYWMWETKVMTATWTFYLQCWQIDLRVSSLKTHMLSEIADLFLKNRTKQEYFIHLYPAPGNCSITISPLMKTNFKKSASIAYRWARYKRLSLWLHIALWTNGAFTPQYMSLGNLFIVF